MNQNLLNQISQPVNHVARAYEARSGQLQQQRDAKQAAELEVQKQRDNDMLKVFEFAGDGRIEEAKIFAQRKSIEIPPEIMNNADMARGLALSGKFYGDDPAGAQKFAVAWMQTRHIPDYGERILQTSRMTPSPIHTEDRKYINELGMEQFKSGLKSQDFRRELFRDATIESLGGFNPDPTAGATAVGQYDDFIKNDPSGLVGQIMPHLIQQESGGNPNAVSPKGAAGIAQIMPDTARNPGYGVRPLQGWDGKDPRTAPIEEQMRFSRDYLEAMIRANGGDPRLGLAAYNAGPGAVEQYGGIPPYSETQNYVDTISRNSGLRNNQKQESPYQEGQTATNPQTGEKVIFQGGQWTPVSQENNSVVKPPPEITFVDQSNSGYNPNSGYFSSVPSDTRIDRISKNLANYINIPAHVSNIIKAGGSGLRSSANYVGNTAVNAVEGVGDYLNESPYVMVTAPNGKSGYIPREQLQQALSQGYLLGSDNGTPSVPMS